MKVACTERQFEPLCKADSAAMHTHRCVQIHQPAQHHCNAESSHCRPRRSLNKTYALHMASLPRPCIAFGNTAPSPCSSTSDSYAPRLYGLDDAVAAAAQTWIEAPILSQSCLRLLGLTLLALYAADLTVKWVNYAAVKAKGVSASSFITHTLFLPIR